MYTKMNKSKKALSKQNTTSKILALLPILISSVLFSLFLSFLINIQTPKRGSTTTNKYAQYFPSFHVTAQNTNNTILLLFNKDMFINKQNNIFLTLFNIPGTNKPSFLFSIKGGAQIKTSHNQYKLQQLNNPVQQHTFQIKTEFKNTFFPKYLILNIKQNAQKDTLILPILQQTINSDDLNNIDIQYEKNYIQITLPKSLNAIFLTSGFNQFNITDITTFTKQRKESKQNYTYKIQYTDFLIPPTNLYILDTNNNSFAIFDIDTTKILNNYFSSYKKIKQQDIPKDMRIYQKNNIVAIANICKNNTILPKFTITSANNTLITKFAYIKQSDTCYYFLDTKDIQKQANLSYTNHLPITINSLDKKTKLLIKNNSNFIHIPIINLLLTKSQFWFLLFTTIIYIFTLLAVTSNKTTTSKKTIKRTRRNTIR